MTAIQNKDQTMRDSFYIICFLKFGEEKYIMDLYENGTIYMNSIQFFREFEDDKLRGDSYEGISKIANYSHGEFEIPKLNFKGKYQAIHLCESEEVVLGNIYSLYCISSHGWEKPEDVYIDNKIKEFGSHCLMIKDCKKFINLIKDKLNELNLEFCSGFVDYYDKDKANQNITPFDKIMEFEYQKEFRFCVERNSIDALQFSIGSLKEISELFPCEAIIDGLTLERK